MLYSLSAWHQTYAQRPVSLGVGVHVPKECILKTYAWCARGETFAARCCGLRWYTKNNKKVSTAACCYPGGVCVCVCLSLYIGVCYLNVKPTLSNAILVAIAQYVHRKLWPSNPLYSAWCAGCRYIFRSLCVVCWRCAHTATAFISVLRYWFITFMAFYRKYLIAKAFEEKFLNAPIKRSECPACT